MSHNSSQALLDLESLKSGDSEAWEVFFREHDGLIRSVVAWSRWRFGRHVQEDVAQQIRLELTSSIPRFRGETTLPNYVKRICVRRCIDQVRREIRDRGVFVPATLTDRDGRDRAIEFPDVGGLDPRACVERSERAQALRSLLEQLDPLCQTAIRQFYLEQKTYKEIAELNEIKVNTTGSRLSKCLDKLRALAKRSPHFRE